MFMFMYQPMFIYIYIIPTLIISPIFSISMNSWFSIWLSLEFNLMTFIPFIIYFNKFYKNISMKYFIIQAFSSSMLILSSNLQLINIFDINNIINIMMNLSILIKLGAAPFHNWFINLMNNLNWISCLILSTWQKISPMILIMYSFNNKIIYFSIFMSSLIGSIMGLNHQSLRLIISYSSINHISWMLLNLMINEFLWLMYFLSYFLINCSIMLIFNKFNIFFLNQMNKINNKFHKMMILFNFISISGMPPMFGFMMKWYSIYFMNWNNNYLLIIILVNFSILTFFFYMRICLILIIQINLILKNNFMLNYKINFNKNFKINKFLFINSFLFIWTISIWLF